MEQLQKAWGSSTTVGAREAISGQLEKAEKALDQVFDRAARHRCVGR
jgi:hypothetical protein